VTVFIKLDLDIIISEGTFILAVQSSNNALAGGLNRRINTVDTSEISLNSHMRQLIHTRNNHANADFCKCY